MTKELIEELKKAISYTDNCNTCESCKHSEEVDDPNLDRSWYWVCHLNSLFSFCINKNGRCNKHELK